MPRLPAKLREAEKTSTPLPGGSYAASANDVPSRKTWDAHAVSLLSKLNGDRKKRKQAIDAFIRVLANKREEFRKEKKTGAGVTSEAIEFYQYVSKLNHTWKAKSGRKRLSEMNGTDTEDDENSEGDNESSASLQSNGDTDEEFLDQHNDFCQVCLTGGELICCSTCSLVFHLNCTQPHLKSMPPDSWSCAHCDAAGVTGYKKDSKQRKRAMQAVRDMERMAKENLLQNSIEEGEDGPKNNVKTITNNLSIKKGEGFCNICCTTGPDVFPCSTCENAFHVHCVKPPLKEEPKLNEKWSCAFCEMRGVTGLKKKSPKRLAAAKAVKEINMVMAARLPSNDHLIEKSDSKKRSLEEVDFNDDATQQRGRRQRRQPSLYNPSNQPFILHDNDSKEESSSQEKDAGPTKSSKSVLSKDQIPTHIVKRLSSKPQNNTKSGFHCKFCMDDEKSQTCCFCACRVCFSKHDKCNTILCDMCDSEYHISCLSPPLKKIPSHDWFCPTCMEVISKAQRDTNASAHTSSNNSNSSTKTKSPGAKKNQTKAPLQTPKKKNTLTKAQARNIRSTNSQSQPRTAAGRFASKPKSNSPVTEQQPPLKKKRGPGRPPKNKSAMARNDTKKAQSITSPKIVSLSTRSSRSKKEEESTNTTKHLKEAKENNKTNMSSAPSKSSPSKNKKIENEEQANVGDSEISDPSKKPMFSSSGMLPSSTNQRSRSGRVVKRNTAYDETILIEQRKAFARSSSSSNESKKESHVIDKTSSSVKKDAGPSEKAGKSVIGEGFQELNPDVVSFSKEQVEMAAVAVMNSVSGESESEKIKPQTEKADSSSSILINVIKEKTKSLTQERFNSAPGTTKASAAEVTTSKTAPCKKEQNKSNTDVTSSISSYSEQLEASRALISDANIEKASPSPSGVPSSTSVGSSAPTKVPRRKPGARECMQISRRFGANVIPQNYVETLLDYCTRGKVEHLIRMRERLDEHSMFLESQLAGLEMMVQTHGEDGLAEDMKT